MDNKQQLEEPIDLTKVYDFKEFPDKQSGRCDNCGNAHFKSSIHGGEFLRECRKCGLKKII